MLARERTLYPVGAVNSQFGEFTVGKSRKSQFGRLYQRRQ
jgi:hypothetical protein